MLNFLVATLEKNFFKEMDGTNFNDIVYLTQHVPNIITSTCALTLQPCGLWSTRRLFPWSFSGMNTGVGCHFLLPNP